MAIEWSAKASEWSTRASLWRDKMSQWLKTRREEAIVHENFMHANISSFKAALPPIAGDHNLDGQLSVYTKYEEYIIKARQANHPALTMYGPLAIAFAGVLIAIAVAGAGYRAAHTQALRDDRELVLNVLKDSSPAAAENNLLALRKAGLLHMDRDRIKELAKNWENTNH